MAAQGAVVCSGGITTLTKQGGPVTFWLTSERVSRIYQMADLGAASLDYAAIENLFRSRTAQIQSFVGSLQAQVVTHEPPWFSNLDDESKMAWLRSGTFAREVFWQVGGQKLTLLLRGEKSRVVLVLGLESAPASKVGKASATKLAPPTPTVPAASGGSARSCGAAEVAAFMMDLFPPAEPAARAAAAKHLADCKVDRSSGALAAALERDRDPAVRTATLNALGDLGHTEPLHSVLSDPKESDVLRTEALRALDKRGETPAENEQRRLDKSAGSGLARALRELREKKDVQHPQPGEAPPFESSHETSTAQAKATVPQPRSLSAALPSTPTPLAADTPASASIAPVRYTAIEENPAPALAPPAPPSPPKPSDGAALAITTSTLAGGLWGAGLAKLALQDNVGFITLAGSAGALIGGGTALGLVHFGKRPSPEQALFYTNTTAWGSLAGLLAWSGSGSDSVKLKYGLLVGGELGGMAAGVWGAHRWQWTASQIFVADSLVAAAGVGGLGVERMLKDSMRLDVPAWVGYGAAPVMVAAAVASRYLDVSGNDLRFAGIAGIDAAWMTGLIASGIDRSGLFSGHVGQGGLMLGFSAGYLAAIAASPFIDISGSQALLGSGALLVGNGMGLGTHILLSPNDSSGWALGAGLGGLGFLAAGALAAPYLRLGPQATGMATSGFVFGAGTWAAATLAAGRPADARLGGGLLAFAPAAGIVGALASAKFNPDGVDYATTAATTALGMGAGLGVGMLSTSSRGNGEFVGVLGGSLVGLAGGALFADSARPQIPDLGGAAVGAAEGLLLGQLVPTLHLESWESSRNTQGASWLGVSAGAVAGVTLSHMTSAGGGNIVVASAGGLLGTGAGIGAGLLLGHTGSQPERIGAVAGSLGGLATGMLLDHPLHLSDGLASSAPPLALLGGLAGAANGVFLADVVHPDSDGENTQSRRGGALLGASLGVASGLLLSKRFDPGYPALATAAGGSLAGALMGRGLMMVALDNSSTTRADSAGTMAGSLAGLGLGALAAHASPLTPADALALPFGAGFGGLVGALVPTFGDATSPGWQRTTEGGALLGVGAGAVAATTLSHMTRANPAQVAASATAGVTHADIVGTIDPKGNLDATAVGTIK